LPSRGGRARGKGAAPGLGAALALGLAAAIGAPVEAAAYYPYFMDRYYIPDQYITRPYAPHRRGDTAKRGQAERRRGEAAKRSQAEKTPRGPLHLVVSIASQSVSLYADGAFVARAPVSTGMRGHPTPTGIFTVIQKHKWHQSNIYSLAPMPYMQRITWSGVALHAGVLPGYPASHGCIRLPYDFATRLWGITRMGTRVIVARSDVAPVEIAHPHLFAPKPKTETPAAVHNPPAGLDAIRPSVHPEPGEQARPADPGKSGESASPPMVRIAGAAPPTDAAPPGAAAVPAPPTPRKTGVVSVFVSRKTGKLYVRQNYQPLFEAPVAIRNPERPLGTHVYTAMELKEDGAGMRWTAVTMPADAPVNTESLRPHGKRKAREDEARGAPVDIRLVRAAGEALDRIEMPQDAVERISEILIPGSSLIVSDQGISDETGSDTDFIILTR